MNKKSLINTLKTTKKANVAASPAKKEGKSTRKSKIGARASFSWGAADKM